ncbi:histidine kinase with HAMP domain protein [alpha proteobacterium HIMB59]|nr:histidine kinase with HAMP domain protein [alpha proteobacterium HIMB59]
MFKWSNFSGSLLVRSVYLITLPIVLVQVVGIIIFFELHWDLVLKRSAQSIANEIKILELNKDDEEIDKFANTLQIIKTDQIQIDEVKPISNWIFKKRMNQSLGQIPGQFTASQNDNFYVFSNTLNDDYYYLIPKKRVETKTVAGFFLWTIAVSIILSLISYFFIKKQIQPLKRLGIITKSFGRGVDTPNLKPTGSSEVRGLISDFNNMQNNINSTFENQRNMLAGISHDLKTPLTRINLMIEELNNEEIKSSISKNISEMNIMLNHYLDFIKNEKNENLDETIADNLIQDITNNYQKISILRNDSKKVLIRKNQVKRALINILDNANKFAENIYLSSTIQSDKWLISVEDDGPGTNLTEEQLVRPFVKGSEQLNQGTGLGLSIVQKLIKLNNGELKFGKSNYGGLKVTISFEIQ